MTFKVPLPVSYSSPITFIPGVWDKTDPTEGTGYCPFVIDWGPFSAGGMGGPNNSIAINLQNNVQSPNSMSQIAAITVDNSDCGSDVVFVFPDTQETITIPAYSPNDTIPVFSRSVLLYVVATGAIFGDETRFLLHNVMPPPIAVPESEEQETAVFNNIAANATAVTQLVPATVSGTLENVSVFYSFFRSGGGNYIMWSIQDGNGKVIAGGQASDDSTIAIVTDGPSLEEIHVRFVNGLSLHLTSTGGGFNAQSRMAVNLYYRTP